MRSKAKISPTLFVEETYRKVASRHDAYKAAKRNYQKLYPERDAATSIASELGRSSKWFYAILEGERNFTSIVEEEHFFKICQFPLGFEMKRQFVFGQ